MALGTGLDAQIGLGIESVVGTVVAPTDFYEFNNETIKPTVAKLYSFPANGGRLQRAARVRTYITAAAGDVELDMVSRGLLKLYQMMFGTVVSAQVDDTDEYTHTYTLSAAGFRGLSATVQVGRPSAGDAVVNPFNYVGGKVSGWEIAADLDKIATVKPTFDFIGVNSSQALATASYATDAEPFTFLDGALTLDSSAFGTVSKASIMGKYALATDRRSFGNAKKEQLANGEWEITGSFDSEFESTDAYDAWVAGTQQATLVLSFALGEISTTENPFKVEITIPVLEYTGDVPNVSGPDVVKQSLPFKALWNESDEIITMVVHTDETAP